MSHFTLTCRACGKILENVYCAFCEHCRGSLLVTTYNDRFAESTAEGIWRFNWLPVHHPRVAQQGPLVYRSEGLAEHLGLHNLHISFSGYWPERGISLKTCTFKEFEAAVVLQNAIENEIPSLIVASAGNTARAFACLSERADFPVVIVVPQMCLTEMWYPLLPARTPTLVVGDGDYSDAIDFARKVASALDIPFEGGVKNIAKRDGLGVVLLEAVSRMGKLPDHYFQAVGSGAGAIGIWEMAERFLRDGRFGKALPKLHLAQNLPFAPMVHAWKSRNRLLDAKDLDPSLIGEITTRVLSSRYPAYGVMGGVYDALTATEGEMYGVTNDEVFNAMDLFQKAEGIDIVPAAGVAVAALLQGVEGMRVKKKDTILLNITGGGEKKFKKMHKAYEVEPHFVSKKISEQEIKELLWPLLNKN